MRGNLHYFISNILIRFSKLALAMSFFPPSPEGGAVLKVSKQTPKSVFQSLDEGVLEFCVLAVGCVALPCAAE